MTGHLIKDSLGEKVVQEALRRVLGATQPSKMIVFGSYARGQERKGSDLDLLIVYDDLPRDQKRQRAQELARLLWDLDLATDVIVANREDIERRSRIVGYIYGPALEEGVTVYERST